MSSGEPVLTAELPIIGIGRPWESSLSRSSVQVAVRGLLDGSHTPPPSTSSQVWANANARTTNWSEPSSPSSRNGAWLAYTMKVSLPVPPVASSGADAPGLNQPRVVAISRGNTSCARTPPWAWSRLVPKIWPMANVSKPAPPSRVIVVVVSST